MISPLILIRILKFLESVCICLFPLAIVTSITLSGILIYLGAFTFAVLLILKQKEGFNLLVTNKNWHVSAFLIYISTFTLSKFVNSGLASASHIFLRTCQDYFVFLWVLFFVLNDNKKTNLLKYSLVFAVFISVVYGVMQFFHLDFFHRQININRLSGFHKNPYSYAGQLIVFFFFLLAHFREKSNYIFTIVLLVACLFCIINTSERAVIIGVCFGLIFYFIFQMIKVNSIDKKYLMKLFLILLIPVLLTIFFSKKVTNRIKYSLFPKKGVQPNTRFKIWQIGLAIWKRNIIFGNGQFPTIYHQIEGEFPLRVLTHAHNVYLQILVTNGVIGLFGFLNLFTSIVIHLLKRIKYSEYVIALLCILSAFFVEGFFEYFWGDSEVRYLLLYFIGFVFGWLEVRKEIVI